jgi:hypothetical protein
MCTNRAGYALERVRRAFEGDRIVRFDRGVHAFEALVGFGEKAFEDATYRVGSPRRLQPTQFEQDRYIDVVRHVTL